MLFGCIIAAVILVLGITAGAAGCNAEVFDGNSVKNQDNFFLRFTRMSKTDAHIINAEAGDVISVELEIEKGRVDIVIGAEGNDVDSGKFELPVSAAGQYKVTVEVRGGGKLPCKGCRMRQKNNLRNPQGCCSQRSTPSRSNSLFSTL